MRKNVDFSKYNFAQVETSSKKYSATPSREKTFALPQECQGVLNEVEQWRSQRKETPSNVYEAQELLNKLVGGLE